MKNTIEFIDSKRVKHSISIDLRENNKGRNIISFSGQGGQIVDQIAPANEYQKELKNLWLKYHLNDVNSGTEKQKSVYKNKGLNYEEVIALLENTGKDLKPVSFSQKVQIQNHSLLFPAAKREINGLNKWYDNELKKVKTPEEKEDTKKYYTDQLKKYTDDYNLSFDIVSKNCLLYDIHPDSKELFKYGSAHIFLELPEDIDTIIEELIENIEEVEEAAKDNLVSDFGSDIEIIEKLIADYDFDNEEAEKIGAICQEFELSFNEIEDIELDDDTANIQGTEYYFGDNDTMNSLTADNVKESIWAFNASFLASYTGLPEEVFAALQDQCEGANDPILMMIEKFGSIEDFTADAISCDGRGHFLNTYDGTELETSFNGTDYFFCQQ